jgi:hypothetical protein
VSRLATVSWCERLETNLLQMKAAASAHRRYLHRLISIDALHHPLNIYRVVIPDVKVVALSRCHYVVSIDWMHENKARMPNQ